MPQDNRVPSVIVVVIAGIVSMVIAANVAFLMCSPPAPATCSAHVR